MRIPSAAAALVLIVTMLAACGRREETKAAAAPEVPAAYPIRQNMVDWDDFVGRFQAQWKVEVRARTSGYIQGVHFRDGQTVRAGQLLVTLDPRPAQAQYDIARAQSELARADFRRGQALLAAGAVSKEEYDTRRANASEAAATQRARALDLEFTRVYAPISGVVSEIRVDPGNLIAGGTSAGDILTTIVSSDPIYFYFNASEGQLLKYLRAAQERGAPAVRIRLLDETEYRWQGSIDFFDNALDVNSGTIVLRAIMPNGRAFLRSGMVGHARVQGTSPYAALLVPDAAIVTDGARRVVYVVATDNKVRAKAVTLGPLSGSLRVVLSGLSPTDRVITNALQRVNPGQLVNARMTGISLALATEPAPQITTMPQPASAATPVRQAPAKAAASSQTRAPQGSAATPRPDTSVRGRRK